MWNNGIKEDTMNYIDNSKELLVAERIRLADEFDNCCKAIDELKDSIRQLKLEITNYVQ